MKSHLYSVLIARLDQAYSEKNFFESSWYAYAVIEDRLISLLRLTGGETINGKPIMMLGRKIEILEKRVHHNSALKKFFTQKMQDDLDAWRDERNQLMHDMGTGTITLDEIDRRSQQLSLDGKKVVRELCSVCWKMKHELNKKNKNKK